MKTGSIVLCTTRNSNSCEHVSTRIYKGSYALGDLRDTGTLTAGVDDTSSMASSTGRSVEVHTRSSSISGSDLGSSTTADSDSRSNATSSSGSDSSTTIGSGSASAATLILALALCQPLVPCILLYPSGCPLESPKTQRREGAEHTEYEVALAIQTNIDRNYDCLSTTSKVFQQTSFGHSDTSIQMLE